MAIETSREGEIVSMRLFGSMDSAAFKEFQVAFEKILTEGVRSISLDFSEVDYIGSSGIGTLNDLHRRCSDRGIEFRIRNPNIEVFSALKIANLDTLIHSPS